MKQDLNQYGPLDDKDILENLLKEESLNSEQTLESIDHRIAERKNLEYKNILDLERQRQKIEGTINSLQCFSYNPNPKLTMVKSKLETEMTRFEMKKGEEAVHAFRDVERLEAEKRKILEDIRGEKQMMNLSPGGYK